MRDMIHKVQMFRETPIDWRHIVDRFIIHIFSSGSIVLLMLWVAWLLESVLPGGLLSGWNYFAWPSMIAFILISFREIWDVKAGGSIIKSVIDWMSWLIGMAIAVLSIYVLSPRISQAVEETLQ